jgi:hypothetical protein
MITNEALCPVCGDGHIEKENILVSDEYNGFDIEYYIIESWCNCCGVELLSGTDLNINRRNKQEAQNNIKI